MTDQVGDIVKAVEEATKEFGGLRNPKVQKELKKALDVRDEVRESIPQTVSIHDALQTYL